MVRAVFRDVRSRVALDRCTSTCMPSRRPSRKNRDAPPTPQISPHPQPAVPETALKRRKRDEAWAAKKAAAEAEAKAAAEKNSQEIFKRAEKYVKEYRDQVRFGAIPAASASVFPASRWTLRPPRPRAHGSRETGPRTACES